ncbi:MAG: glycolate oxidase [Armatimonadota bacterium]
MSNTRDAHEKALKCIRCGFCLEDCPTFVLTGSEAESPRGRIYLIRTAIENGRWSEEMRPHIERCLGCRACETACPSGVEYGYLLETARERLWEASSPSWLRRVALKVTLIVLTRPRLLRSARRVLSALGLKRPPGLVSHALFGAPAEASFPRPEMRSAVAAEEFPPPTRTAFFLQGCVMSALFERSNEATVRLMRRHACEVDAVEGSLCCGALHRHQGMAEEAKRKARALIRRCRGDAPVVVNSAGCGSAMKEYGHWFADDEDMAEQASQFSRRVLDICEWLKSVGFRPPEGTRAPVLVAYHDACHLAHGQGVRRQPRELLSSVPGIQLVPLSESDRCCGSAGVYNVLQPEMARALLERKWGAIEASGAEVVVAGNPGCIAWLRQAAEEHGSPIRVVHTVEALLGEGVVG